jgi:hypothetical protein
MRGHIDKFKGVPGRDWNGEIITDLRQKIRKRPMSERKVLVVVQNLPPDLKSQQVMTILATRVGGTVRRVDLSSVRNSCEVGFVDEADAVKFHFGLNETPFDNVIITCEAPTYDPLAEDYFCRMPYSRKNSGRGHHHNGIHCGSRIASESQTSGRRTSRA